MADLIAIYNEFGLSGIVPHAIRRNTKGYQMLIDKIKQGDKLYYMESFLNVPYLIVKDETYQTPVFTSLEMAEAEQAKVVKAHYQTQIKEIPAGEGREQYVLTINNSGISALFIDDAISLQLSNFCTLPSYDGQPHDNLMLRNTALNGATYYYLQFVNSHTGNRDAEFCWARQMAQSKFLLAVEDKPNEGYPIITKHVKGKTAYLVYSDWSLMEKGLAFSAAGLVISFDELDALLNVDDTTILFNDPTAHIFLDKGLLIKIRKAASAKLLGNTNTNLLNHRNSNTTKLGFDQVPEDEWETADPMPAWLQVK